MIPYIPFFSNCQNFGQEIFFFSLCEYHKDCDLIDFQDTYSINPFVLGDIPNSDTCENLPIECIYDEQISNDVDYNEDQAWFK